MDECEHLCNRLAIMTLGQLKCIGPIQQLKQTFGIGFLVTIMIKKWQAPERVLHVKEAMSISFRCTLREEYGVSKFFYFLLISHKNKLFYRIN